MFLYVFKTDDNDWVQTHITACKTLREAKALLRQDRKDIPLYGDEHDDPLSNRVKKPESNLKSIERYEAKYHLASYSEWDNWYRYYDGDCSYYFAFIRSGFWTWEDDSSYLII